MQGRYFQWDVDSFCILHVESCIFTIKSKLKLDSVVLKSKSLNVVCNKNASFKLSVTLWIFEKKARTVALIDSGTTTNFVNKSFVEKHNLITTKLANPYEVRNADGTSNKAGNITHAVRAYIEIGTHKHTQYLLVTNLGDKDMYIGYQFLHRHNPEIDWAKGDWKFTRCSESCHVPRRQTKAALDLEFGIEESIAQLELVDFWEEFLENLDIPDNTNQFIFWLEIDQVKNQQQAKVIADVLNKLDDDDNVNTFK